MKQHPRMAGVALALASSAVAVGMGGYGGRVYGSGMVGDMNARAHEREALNERLRAMTEVQRYFLQIGLNMGVSLEDAMDRAEKLDPEITIEELKASQKRLAVSEAERRKAQDDADARAVLKADEKRRRRALKLARQAA